jgi:hypothetical protein
MATGQGLLVAWYDADPAFQPELDQWHAKEHMPERVNLPGFLTGQRYADWDKEGSYCVLYRTVDVRTFVSERYLQVLNNPTEWTRRIMPGVRNLNRSLCSISREVGEGFGNILHTFQLSPPPNAEAEFLKWIDEFAIPAVFSDPHSVRLTLAASDKEISRTKTNEQALRSQPDAVSDWIMLIETYGTRAAVTAPWETFSASLSRLGINNPIGRTFHLSHLLVS